MNNVFRKKTGSSFSCKIMVLLILFSPLFFQELAAQGFFLENDESGIITSLDAYLDPHIYGFSLSAGVAPKEFMALQLSLGKMFQRDDEYRSQFISPQFTIYPMRIFIEYPFSFSLFAMYRVQQFDFEEAESALLFQKSEKIKTKTFGGSLYYIFNINSTFKFIPETGVMKSYRKHTRSSIEKDESATDLAELYQFLFQTQNNDFIEWFVGINLSQQLGKEHTLYLTLTGKYHTTLRSQLTIGMVF